MYSNIRFHENPCSGSQGVPYEQTGMTKLIAAFQNFAKAPNCYIFYRIFYIDLMLEIKAI
jgi:hypothetical protein